MIRDPGRKSEIVLNGADIVSGTGIRTGSETNGKIDRSAGISAHASNRETLCRSDTSVQEEREERRDEKLERS